MTRDGTAYARPVRLAGAALVLSVAFVVGAGCAQSGYDVNKLQRELVRAGLTPSQAQCVTDGMQGTFDINQLGSHSEPTQKEIDTTRSIVEGCGVRLP